MIGADRPLLGSREASNNFVIHGNHTATGMPLFGADPHLANDLPSLWILYSLEFTDGRVYSGATLPGTAAIGVGRTNDIAWSFTTSRVDAADLWLEELNEDESEYFVDNEWRKLEVITEVIKVKGKEDIVVPIKKTHRGSVVPFELLRINGAMLFSGEPA